MPIQNLMYIVALIGSVALAVAGYLFQDELPEAHKMSPLLDRDPIQTLVEEEEFVFDYMGRSYVIQPVAEYEQWGLVVSHNDITAFDDIYHDSSSVDIKDLCLVWGENVQDGIYNEVQFSSEPWSCAYRTESKEIFRAFNPRQFANNHILSDNAQVRETINRARIGDQVWLKGILVNYHPEDRPEWLRRSSTSRKDKGNGACEVIFVEEAKILETGAVAWRRAYEWGKFLVIGLLALKPVLIVWGSYRYKNRPLE